MHTIALLQSKPFLFMLSFSADSSAFFILSPFQEKCSFFNIYYMDEPTQMVLLMIFLLLVMFFLLRLLWAKKGAAQLLLWENKLGVAPIFRGVLQVFWVDWYFSWMHDSANETTDQHTPVELKLQNPLDFWNK